MTATAEIRARLEYLRGEIRAERISYGEIAELQGLAPHIDAADVELLEWAGMPEGGRKEIGEIRDNGGRTADRYTIEILYGVTDGDYEGAYYIGAGDTGNVPNGFFMTVDGPAGDPEITFEELPERVQRDVLREIGADA